MRKLILSLSLVRNKKRLLHSIKTEQEAIAQVRRGQREESDLLGIYNENSNKLDNIIERIGWPTVSKVGADAAKAAFVIAQHTPDLHKQKKYLSHINKEPAGEVQSMFIAYLEDRMRVREGRSQVYGTQSYRNSKGEYVLHDLEDPSRVNELRESVGLGPLK